MLVGQLPKEGLSTIFTAWSHLHFSFCEFAIYFSKAVKKGLVKKVLACVDIIRRKVLQDDGFVLPVHIKNDSQGCFSDLIHSVFQSSGSKLRAKKDVAFLKCTFTDLKHKCTFFLSWSGLLEEKKTSSVNFWHVMAVMPSRHKMAVKKAYKLAPVYHQLSLPEPSGNGVV